MMTSQQNRPFTQKLPSFNELTSKFSNNLQIESSAESNTTSPAPNSANQTPSVRDQHELLNLSTKQAAAAAASSAPSVPRPIQYISHPQQVHQVQQPQVYPQTQYYQNQQPPQRHYGPPQQVPPPVPIQPLQQSIPQHQHQQFAPQQFGRPIQPRYPSELTSYQFPKQEPNYVIAKNPFTGEYNPSSNQQTGQQLPLVSSNFDHDRRLSMQYPSYPSTHTNHNKKDSYDSQTSLSTLADIASSNDLKKQDERLKEFAHSTETLIEKFRKLTRVFNDVHYDFTTQIEKSMNESSLNDVKIKLLFEYTSSDNKIMNEISIPYLKNFISNIPILALVDTIEDIDYVRSVLQKWLELKRGVGNDDENREDSRLTTPTSATSNSNPSNKLIRPSNSRNHSRQSSRNKFHLQRHQSISAIGKKTGSSIDSEPFNKKRRSISSAKLPSSSSSTSLSTNLISSNKSDSVSLVVNPPKPVMDSNYNQPPAKGIINEELSIKLDHKCEQCGSDETPEWRRGPYGSRSLCNACGLFYGKLIKKFDYDQAAKIMLKRKNQGNGDDRRIPID